MDLMQRVEHGHNGLFLRPILLGSIGSQIISKILQVTRVSMSQQNWFYNKTSTF